MDEQFTKSMSIMIDLHLENSTDVTWLLNLVVVVVNSLAFVHVSVVKWLHQKHQWHAKEGNDDTCLHEWGLHWNQITILSNSFLGRLLVNATVEEHGDHGHDDTWWLLVLLSHSIPICEPLADNHPVHESEKCNKHHELSHCLEDQIDIESVINLVRHA